MRELFSAEGLARLDRIATPGLLCAFDFDGTLAPIVQHPDDARMPPATLELVQRLARLAPVAIITGRSVDDIRERLGFTPDFLVGNHGLEGVPGWEERALRHQRESAAWRDELAAAIEAGRFGPGIMLEDKRFSLSLHFRMAPDQDAAARALEDYFPKLQPAPRIVPGKLIYSLMPQDGGHKGSALEQLMQVAGARHAIYAGDDVTDEDVFRLRRPDVLTVRVEPRPDSAAEFLVPRQADMPRVLEALLERLERAGVSRRVIQ